MEIILEFFIWMYQPIPLFLYICIGLFIWYALYGSEFGTIGGDFSLNNCLMPFVVFYKEITWRILGGEKRKEKFLRYLFEKCDSDNIFIEEEISYFGDKEIDKEALYLDWSEGVLKNSLYFWGVFVACPLLLPLTTKAILICVICVILYFICKRAISYIPVKSS